MEKKNDIGVGLIGTGFMGKSHALAWHGVRPVFGDVPEIRLESLCEISQALADERAAEFGFRRATDNWRTLIDDPAIDVISITAPNAFHAQMAIAALAAGKHVWCEKPMAPSFAEAEAMNDAARASGRTAILGYNYIQNPMIGHIRKLLDEDAIGRVNHLRFEMDEDFMADPDAPFHWRNEKTSGYGVIDDFAVHPLSIIRYLFGAVSHVMVEMIKPYADRPVGHGEDGRRPVQTHDVASALIRLADGVSGSLNVSRTAWGRKSRIAIQIFGAHGSILFDQERMNELQLFTADGRDSEQGFRTILSAPVHPPYGRFVPAPGHQLGFNDLKIIECRQLLGRIAGEDTPVISFTEGLEIERTVHAMARSFETGEWVDVSA
jgi:predicted dehydrogenase